MLSVRALSDEKIILKEKALQRSIWQTHGLPMQMYLPKSEQPCSLNLNIYVEVDVCSIYL